MIRLGIALDDTTIRVGLIDDEAVRVLQEGPVPTGGAFDDVVDQMGVLIDRLPIVEAESIGVSVPEAGPGANGDAEARAALQAGLEERYGIPTFVRRAAHCFALAEARYGAGRGQSPVVAVRVGRRLDGGIVVNNRLVGGQTGAAGRFGRAPYRDGTYDDYCGGRFLERHHEATAAEIVEEAEEGDEAAVALFADMGTHLGRALRSMCCALDPACIVIGGSLAQAHPFFEDDMRTALTLEGGPAALEDLALHRSTLRHVDVLGAAALGREHNAQQDVAS